MKAAVIILAAVSALLAGDSLSSASHIVRVSERYEVDTPAPSGQMECGVIMEFKKDAGTGGTIFAELVVTGGEAQMSLWWPVGGGRVSDSQIRDGFQPGCPLYSPPGPIRTKIPLLDAGRAHFTQGFRLNVHAHPGSDCLVGGHASGIVSFEHNIAPEFHPFLAIWSIRCNAPRQAEEDD